jgi:hypothetical protein
MPEEKKRPTLPFEPRSNLPFVGHSNLPFDAHSTDDAANKVVQETVVQRGLFTAPFGSGQFAEATPEQHGGARPEDATRDYPHLSQWPVELGPVPTDGLLVQAYALLRAARPRARPEGSHKALAVAAYLSGHHWWPDNLGRAIDLAMGKQNGAGNDPRNVITERRTGLERLGFVDLFKQRIGRQKTWSWSATLTAKGEAVVADYCATRGIENPVAAARQQLDEHPPQPLFDVAELRRIIPAQKVAPIQFEIRNGRLALQRRRSATAAEDRASTEIAREELLRGGQRILTELRGSNCDRRLIESLEYLQEQLSTGESIIRVGLSNIACEMMCGVYEAELPDAVASMIRSHTRGVDMFAAQFPEWNRFVENAAAVHINENDVAAIHATTKSLVQRLDAEANLVDPEVPETLSRLNNLISDPRTASKRAAFAILRSIENLVSKVFSCGADLMEKTVTKTIDGLSTVASKALIVGLLTIALTGASSIGPLASKVKEMASLKSAAELVERQLERMLKE